MREVSWLVVAMLVAGVSTFAACDDETPWREPDRGTMPAGADASPPRGDSGGGSSSGGTIDGGGDAGDGGSGDDPNATPPSFKVAFIGDTSTGQDFKDVLALIKRENAKVVMVQGDLTYSGDTPAKWFGVIDGALTIPYFVSKGNHDADWSTIASNLKSRYSSWGVSNANDEPSARNYSLVYKGLKMVFIDEAGSQTDRADYAKNQLAGDTHYWKICSWHKNMRSTNVGPKSDEMSWTIYENCRSAGAIVAQGHSHTYSRSKTVTADQALTVDSTCGDPFALCVGPGKHFFFDSSVGGVDLRSLQETNRAHWASTYSSDFGALFIEFNVDGDPKKAKGYFKTVGDMVIDPPSSSGKQFFTITSSN